MSEDSRCEFPTKEEPDALLARLQDSYTRQKRVVAAEKRKQADVAQQAAAAYYSDLPITLELLSDETASLFTELEHLMEAKQDLAPTARQEVVLLQRIRTAVNHELRQSMHFIEEGYQSGFEKLLWQTRFDERKHLLLTASNTPPSMPPASRAVVSSVAQPAAAPSVATPFAPDPPSKTQLTVREALSEHLSLVAESLAVLLQCETVRIYLYDEHENLRCAAQFPYRACRADPFQSSSLALMTVREVHQAVCRDLLAVNGTLDASGSNLPTPPPSNSPTTTTGPVKHAPTGVDDIRSCLLFPLPTTGGKMKSYGMIHAVNKRFPDVVGSGEESSEEVPLRGFSAQDEVVVSCVARLLSTTLSRYPADAFTSTGVGETIRRRAYPGDEQVGSLSAHLPPALYDDIAEAAEVGQRALNHTLPTLVFRAPVKSIFASRAMGESRRRSISPVSADQDATVSTVAFRLRCMSDLWESSREDNTTLHQQYRVLKEEAQKTQLLLRNVLDGVATARSMHVSADVAQYLQTLEVYGRSERTQCMASFVADNMLMLWQNKEGGSVGLPPQKLHETTADNSALSVTELRRLQHNHATLNTVTVASLHYDGPDGVPSYTSAPVQKREQVRFIDELRRSHTDTAVPPAGVIRSMRGNGRGGRGGGATASPLSPPPTNTLPHLAANTTRTSHRSPHPFQRPFKL